MVCAKQGYIKKGREEEMKKQVHTIQTKEDKISYTHMETGSKQICFMFADTNYSYDKPLFYYSTMKMIENNIDVIHIHYSYGKNILEHKLPNMTDIMMEKIEPVIEWVLQKNAYENVLFLGKSLGTIPIIDSIMKQEKFLESKMILFTPLLKIEGVFESLLESKHNGLILLGNKDSHYDGHKRKLLEETLDFKIKTIKHANHSLNHTSSHTKTSIETLIESMRQVQKVIEKI